jgi:SAM-dependent methyltransferase
MKVITSDLYDSEYCERIDAKQWRHDLTPLTMKVLYDHFKPNSVIDIGCANGLHLRAFKDLGVRRLFGIEGTVHWVPYIEKYFGYNYIIADLREPLPKIGGKFDLVICFEVLEHLEKSFASRAVDNLISFGDTLCVSACPSKGGFHHFNPKPKEYWIKKFEKRNFKYCEDEVNELQEIYKNMNCSGWFKTSLKIFRCKDGN